jgi:hypothetical protein
VARRHHLGGGGRGRTHSHSPGRVGARMGDRRPFGGGAVQIGSPAHSGLGGPIRAAFLRADSGPAKAAGASVAAGSAMTDAKRTCEPSPRRRQGRNRPSVRPWRGSPDGVGCAAPIRRQRFAACSLRRDLGLVEFPTIARWKRDPPAIRIGRYIDPQHLAQVRDAPRDPTHFQHRVPSCAEGTSALRIKSITTTSFR